MECNRDEALRAKLIADSKLKNKDYMGARKFALKAQALYPGLDDIQQMLTTIEVYVSSEKKVNGEMDWYAVLSVDPSADTETIRKQYRKLALVLHPDKNKCSGADGAFKLISEGWTLLNDNIKRSAYNQRRGVRVFQPRFPSQNAGPSAPPPARANGFPAPNFAPSAPAPARANGFMKPSAGPSVPPPAPAPAKANGSQKPKSEKVSVPKKNQTAPKPTLSVPKKAPTAPKPATPVNDSFWTVCDKCNTRYEYAKIFLNRTLRCINCKEAFLASEVPRPPKSVLKKTKHIPKKDSGAKISVAAKDSVPRQPDLDSVNSSNLQKVPVSPVVDKMENVSVGGEAGNSSSGTVHPSAGMKRQNGDVGRKGNSRGAKMANGSACKTDPLVGVKRENTIQHLFRDSLKRSFKESYSSGWEEFKKRKQTEDRNHVNPNIFSAAQGNATGFGSGDVKDPPGSRIYGFSKPYPQPRELTAAETRKMLMTKAKREVLNVLREWNTGERKKESRKSTIQGHDQNGKANFCSDKPETGRAKSTNKKANIAAPDEMAVPDADFHDFDGDRTEKSVADNDVWAAYDDKDGMPRTYMSINKVISRKPFKLKIGWLNSKSNPEFSTTKNWAKLGFQKTCGELWVGKHTSYTNINALSHKVASWSKTPRGSVWIIPQKGDIWALYKNWSSDWTAQMPEDVVFKYEMVKVVDEYTEESGVSVAPLVKVVGFKTVFKPNLDVEAIRRIPREEMFRFSHQVMYHLITGEESANAPKGCLDIDPAATPLELLQVITEADGNATASENVDHTGRE